MKIGIDVVDVSEVSKNISDSGEYVNKMLNHQEQKPWSLERLSGKIAAKEAVIKTGFIKPGEWKKILILNSDSGEPVVADQNGSPIDKLQISISHVKSLAVAVAIYEQ